MRCFRCGKELGSADATNADYIVASDTVAEEDREVLIALKHNQRTLDKLAKMQEKDKDGNPKYPDLAIDDSEYDREEVPSVEHARRIPTFAKCVVEVRREKVQKTGIICPECYKPTDYVIWGVHKQTQ